MENYYSCRKCVIFSMCVWSVILSTEAATSVQINHDFEQGSIKYKTFEYRTKLELKCNTTVGADESVKFSWLKDGVALNVVDDNGTRTDSKDASTLLLKTPVETHAGQYSCVVVKNSISDTANVTAILLPVVKLLDNTNVVEGEKLIINCTVHASPLPTISWQIGTDNATKTYTKTDGLVNVMDYKGKEKGDVVLLANGILQINEATMDHRNTYTCIGVTTVGGKTYNASHSTVVRVKDKMAALWPFLGICLEVVVLCTVILIYEKKRNKTEMEESDTDASPEQKNTPDHGKGSDVRHRK